MLRKGQVRSASLTEEVGKKTLQEKTKLVEEGGKRVRDTRLRVCDHRKEKLRNHMPRLCEFADGVNVRVGSKSARKSVKKKNHARK